MTVHVAFNKQLCTTNLNNISLFNNLQSVFEWLESSSLLRYFIRECFPSAEMTWIHDSVSRCKTTWVHFIDWVLFLHLFFFFRSTNSSHPEPTSCITDTECQSTSRRTPTSVSHGKGGIGHFGTSTKCPHLSPWAPVYVPQGSAHQHPSTADGHSASSAKGSAKIKRGVVPTFNEGDWVGHPNWWHQTCRPTFR